MPFAVALWVAAALPAALLVGQEVRAIPTDIGVITETRYPLLDRVVIRYPDPRASPIIIQGLEPAPPATRRSPR